MTKKRIKNFCPIYGRQLNEHGSTQYVYEPLFDCYVFVYIEASQIVLVKEVAHEVNFVYRKDHPAIVRNDEKVNLPSLGFTMVAEVEEKGVMGEEDWSCGKWKIYKGVIDLD